MKNLSECALSLIVYNLGIHDIHYHWFDRQIYTKRKGKKSIFFSRCCFFSRILQIPVSSANKSVPCRNKIQTIEKKCKQMPYTNYREIIHLYVYVCVKGTKVLVIYSSFFSSSSRSYISFLFNKYIHTRFFFSVKSNRKE